MSFIPTERRTFINPDIPFDQYTPEQQEEFKKYMRDKKAKEKPVKKPLSLPRALTITKFSVPFFFDTDQSYLVEKTFIFELKGDVRNVLRIMIDEYAVRGFRYDNFLNDHYLLAEIGGFANQVVSNTNLRAKYDYLHNKHVFFIAKDENINDSSLLSTTNHKYHQIYQTGRQINQTFIDLLKKLSVRFYRRNGSDMFTLHYKNLNPVDSYKLGTEPTFTFVSELGNGNNNTDIRFVDNSLGDSTPKTATITPGVYNTSADLCTIIADKLTRARLIRASSTIGNKKIDFTDGTGLHAVTLDSAEYAYPFSGLTSDVASKMNAAGGQTYTVTFSETTGFITISATSSFTLHWLTQNVTSNAGQMLGYTRAADLTGTSLTSTVTLKYTTTFSLATHKFTISNLTMPSFQLLTSLAAFTAENMLGYSTTDHTGAQTYTSDNTAPQEENPEESSSNQMPFIRLMLWGHFEIDHSQDVNI